MFLHGNEAGRHGKFQRKKLLIMDYNQYDLSACCYGLKFLAHAYIQTRNSNRLFFSDYAINSGKVYCRQLSSHKCC